MNNKKPFYVKPKAQDDSTIIQGFDIEINKSDAERIELLVKDYETRIISHLDEEYLRKTSWSDRIADRIAEFGGSWRFIIYFGVLLVFWMIWNALPFTFHFDEPPYIFLNLCLSFLAAFQAPVIMMSQNRQAIRDKHESIIDFAINYKSEQDIDVMKNHLHRIEGELLQIKQLLENQNHGNQDRKSP